MLQINPFRCFCVSTSGIKENASLNQNLLQLATFVAAVIWCLSKAKVPKLWTSLIYLISSTEHNVFVH